MSTSGIPCKYDLAPHILRLGSVVSRPKYAKADSDTYWIETVYSKPFYGEKNSGIGNEQGEVNTLKNDVDKESEVSNNPQNAQETEAIVELQNNTKGADYGESSDKTPPPSSPDTVNRTDNKVEEQSSPESHETQQSGANTEGENPSCSDKSQSQTQEGISVTGHFTQAMESEAEGNTTVDQSGKDKKVNPEEPSNEHKMDVTTGDESPSKENAIKRIEKEESEKIDTVTEVVTKVEKQDESQKEMTKNGADQPPAAGGGPATDDKVSEDEERNEPQAEEPKPEPEQEPEPPEEKIDPETTLQNQEIEKEAFQSLVDENVRLKSTNDKMQSELDKMKGTYHDMESNIKELTHKNEEQTTRISNLETDLKHAISSPDPLSEEKIKDLEQKLLNIAKQDHEKEKEVAQLRNELRETRHKMQNIDGNNGSLPQNSAPQKSGACAIL
ncbi:hypothetical protein ScPMuIL_009512 [Solemya velum]